MTEQLMEHLRRYILLLAVWLIVVVNAQDLRIVTALCDRAVGESIRMQSIYSPNDPGDPLIWSNPDGVSVGDCQPTISCMNTTGYNLIFSGKTYSLTIENAKATDEGGWDVTDSNFGSRTVNLDLIVYLPGVVVTCNSSSPITVSAGSPQTVMCHTECLDPNLTNATLDISLVNNSIPSVATTSPTTCTSPLFRSSKSITLEYTEEMAGNTSLCYTLTSGQCMYNQTMTDCITVVFAEATLTSSTNPPTTTSPTGPESAFQTGLIVVLACGCTLFVICVVLLYGFVRFVLNKEKDKDDRSSDSDSYRKKGKGVTALQGVSAISFIIVICLTGYALGSNSDQGEPLLYAGIAFLVIGILLLIGAAVVYVKYFRRPTIGNENVREMKVKNSAAPGR